MDDQEFQEKLDKLRNIASEIKEISARIDNYHRMINDLSKVRTKLGTDHYLLKSALSKEVFGDDS